MTLSMTGHWCFLECLHLMKDNTPAELSWVGYLLWTRVCYPMYIKFCLFITVSPPTISITPNRTGVLYAGTPLTLTCSIQLNPAVDTTVMVTRMWGGPGLQGVRNSSHVTMSNILKRSAFLYETTIQFIPLSTTDSGNYKCEATVIPDPQSQFVTMSARGSDTHKVTVQGEYYNYHF